MITITVTMKMSLITATVNTITITVIIITATHKYQGLKDRCISPHKRKREQAEGDMKEKTERKREEKTVKIRIWGIVQGVGFRPFVAKLADRMQMKGEVLNIGGLVDVTVTDTEERIGAFVQALKKEKPEPAEIVHMKETPLPYQEFGEFSILQSDYGDEEAAMIPADLAICPDCLKELYDVTNPRYHHPFISCMICGPRYTIIDSIPYDRENTTMDEFPMCTFCHGQYADRQDRRYHAQTISCHECGPVIKYRLKSKEGACDEGFSTVPIFIAASLIEKGGIIALKGVGGYNFLCDPFNEKAVTNLRRLKHRVRKPFAVMFPNMKKIKEQCYVNAEEEALLTSSPRPIVLLQERKDKKGASICKGVCSDSGAMGVFLPSMGMQYLLLDRTGPVIATSGNVSGMPMITEDEEMLRLLEVQPLLEGVFYNERKIRIPVDDSVVRVIDGQPQMIRRAKGYAPVPLYLDVGRQREQARQGDVKQGD
ncbi:MAG: Sua5/YciO/YrdC/YwlC family protein, partial [Anaerovorax sp.]